jgi:hypothetical protein
MPLHHGTTRARAEAIMNDGPDPDFVEPGGLTKAEGFSLARPGHSTLHGNPERVARGKAALFSGDGGAVILEIDVPEEIVRLSDDFGDEVRFLPGVGLEELLNAWDTLPKRLIELP